MDANLPTGRAGRAGGILGRTAEQDYDALNAVLAQFRAGAPVLWLKRMGRKEWERWYEPENFADVDVLLLEWTTQQCRPEKYQSESVF